MDKVQFCPICKQKGMPPRCPGFWILSEEEPTDSCYYDGCQETKVYNISSDDFHILFKISEDTNFIEAMIKLRQDDIVEYESRMSQFRTQVQQQEQAKKAVEEKSKPHCPTCGSTNIAKISGTSKAASVALWGIFSQKVKRNFHCNNCKSDF